MGTSRNGKAHEAYRRALEVLRDRIRGDVDGMAEAAQGGASSGNLSNVPLHLADLGSDQFDRDLTLGLMEADAGTLAQVEAALVRLEAGRFGTCVACGGAIAEGRLEAIPYAATCIACAREEEGA
jgi:RNA polymerase-binding transcription factor DksA